MSAAGANTTDDPPTGTPQPSTAASTVPAASSPDRAAAAGTGTTASVAVSPSPSKVSIEALAADQKAVLNEKAAIVLIKKTGGKSIVWDPDHGMCKYDFHDDFDVDEDGTVAHKKLKAAMNEKNGAFLYICATCFKDPTTRLSSCIFSLHNNQSANGTHHLSTVHKEWYDAAKGGKSSAAKQLSLFQALTNSDTTKKNVMMQFEHLLFECINDNAITYNTVEKDNFRKLILFVIENAAYLKALGYEKTGRHRLHAVQCDQFGFLVHFVRQDVREIREYYMGVTGVSQPFIIVSHDDWDGNTREIRGLSIMYAHPVTFNFRQIAVALLPPDGKKAIDVKADGYKAFLRYGIEKGDLAAPVNDTTASAGKFLALIRFLLSPLKDRLS